MQQREFWSTSHSAHGGIDSDGLSDDGGPALAFPSDLFDASISLLCPCRTETNTGSEVDVSWLLLLADGAYGELRSTTSSLVLSGVRSREDDENFGSVIRGLGDGARELGLDLELPPKCGKWILSLIRLISLRIISSESEDLRQLQQGKLFGKR